MKKIYLFCIISTFLNLASSTTLMPLTSWINGKEFSTLSVVDTVNITLRCSIAYDINRSLFEEFSKLNPKGLKDKVEVYRWVNSRFSVLLIKDKSKSVSENFIKSTLDQAKNIYDAYYTAMKSNEPIPHSLSSELLATDIGVCNDLDKNIFEAYKQMNKVK